MVIARAELAHLRAQSITELAPSHHPSAHERRAAAYNHDRASSPISSRAAE
jgi:hypothetical protein